MTTASDLDRSSVVASVANAVAQVLQRDPSTITEDTRLFDDLGLDSTTVLQLLMNLEDELDAEFDSDTLEQHHFDTVGTLAQYVIEQS
ncbi:MAG TPA: acyl carrier protein [Mycobacteriales bacterium]|nr:acyl carrier protein [Mycobacteriales bacterium]